MKVIKNQQEGLSVQVWKHDVLLQQQAACGTSVHKGAVDRPDEQHEARCPPKRDDEGSEDRQSQEVRKDSVTAVSAWTLA